MQVSNIILFEIKKEKKSSKQDIKLFLQDESKFSHIFHARSS